MKLIILLLNLQQGRNCDVFSFKFGQEQTQDQRARSKMW